MSDKVNGPSTQYTGPGSRAQGPVSEKENGRGSELYMQVLHDVIERSQFGAKKYGQPLRDTASVDYATNAYQEILDLLIYFRGEINRNRLRNALIYDAWTLIANAGWDANNGDVELSKSEGWHYAALSWRERYHEYLGGHVPMDQRFSEESLTDL